jgi:hypothetical protein
MCHIKHFKSSYTSNPSSASMAYLGINLRTPFKYQIYKYLYSCINVVTCGKLSACLLVSSFAHAILSTLSWVSTSAYAMLSPHSLVYLWLWYAITMLISLYFWLWYAITMLISLYFWLWYAITVLIILWYVISILMSLFHLLLSNKFRILF